MQRSQKMKQRLQTPLAQRVKVDEAKSEEEPNEEKMEELAKK